MKKKIKVLQLIESMGDGGAQRIVLNYLEAFKNDYDIELKVLVYKDKSNSFCNRVIENNNYNVDYLFKNVHNRYVRKMIELILGDYMLTRYIKKYSPDIIHVHISAFLTICLKPISKCNIPIKFDTLHSNPYRFTGKKLNIIKKAFNKEGFIGICLTDEQAKKACSYYGMKKYEIARNGIDIEHIEKSIISKQEAKKKFNIDNDCFVVSSVGRLNKIKKYDMLLEIFKEILKNNENSLLLLAGDGPEKENLRTLSKQLGIDNKVIFLGNVDNPVDVYCASDAFVMTSESEASPLVLIESQICGTYSIISNGVPSESIVTDKVNKMKENATIKEWCAAILDKNFSGKNILNVNDYSFGNSIKRIKEIYIKYWEEYITNEINKNEK